MIADLEAISIRTREMPQEVWVTGQGGQTQQWVLHCNDGAYPLVNIQKTMENHHAINGKIHYNWPFSIAM